MTKKHWLIIFILIFALSLVPLYAIGAFAHPSVDDYFYGAETASVWNETHSLPAVFSKAFSETGTIYQTWQGNFAAIFLMHLEPGIFGEQAYFIAPILLITVFVAAMLFFFVSICRLWLHASRRDSWGIAIAITFVAMQMTYKASDSFYWYNGAIYYTFFFSLMLVLFALVTILLHARKTSTRILCLIPSVLLAALIGGGNFATSLFTMVVLAVMIVLYFIMHSERFSGTFYQENRTTKKNPVSLGLFILIAVIGLTSLAITILAPGNAARQESVGGHQNLLKTFLYTFAYGGYNIASATTFPVVILWLVLLPVFYRIAKDSPYRFRKPLAVLLFSFCVFCAQGTPVFYAQGLRIPYRMMNIIYFAYYPFMAFNLFYLMGWCARKQEEKPGILFSKLEHVYDYAKSRAAVLIIAMILFVIGCIGRVHVSESESEKGSASFTGLPVSVSASVSLINGDAMAYDQKLTARAEILSEFKGDDICVDSLFVTPEPIFHSDITADPEHWKNTHLEKFYHIKHIYIKSED